MAPNADDSTDGNVNRVSSNRLGTSIREFRSNCTVPRGTRESGRVLSILRASLVGCRRSGYFWSESARRIVRMFYRWNVATNVESKTRLPRTFGPSVEKNLVEFDEWKSFHLFEIFFRVSEEPRFTRPTRVIINNNALSAQRLRKDTVSNEYKTSRRCY